MINWYIRHYTYTYLNVGLLEKRGVEFAYAPFINFADLGILNQTIQWDVLQSSLHLSGQPNFPTQPKQNMTDKSKVTVPHPRACIWRLLALEVGLVSTIDIV